MILQNKCNKIQIWSGRYINNKHMRYELDHDLEVYQIEPIQDKPDYYIVEVGKPEDN